MFEMTISPVIEVCKKYRHGVRGMLKSQTHYLVSRYLDVESHFQVNMGFLLFFLSLFLIFIFLSSDYLINSYNSYNIFYKNRKFHIKCYKDF